MSIFSKGNNPHRFHGKSWFPPFPVCQYRLSAHFLKENLEFSVNHNIKSFTIPTWRFFFSYHTPTLVFKMNSYRNYSFGILLNTPIILVGPLNVIFDSVCKEFFGRLAKVGNTANKELVENDTHAPPIHGFSIALSEYHLRCNVFRRSKYLEIELKSYLLQYICLLI